MKTTFSAICIFIAALVTMPLQAQTIKQQGVTYRYNGKNKRTPIGGVYIKAITANNGEVSDEKTGAFTLALNNLKMGSRIGNVRVTKQGMMVFNQQAVDEWSVRKEPLCLILCNAEDFQKQKDNLIAIGRNEAKKKYDQKLTELKRQNDAKQLQLDEYYNKLDSLEKEYQNALKHMDEYADVFARIDESEVDTIAQRAIEMFNRGKIEESIQLLEQQNYLDKIKKANHTIKQANGLISTAEQAKTLAEQDREKYIEGVKTQIAGYKLKNEWGKAKEQLKGLTDELNTLEYIWEYANFCFSQKDLTDAEKYYLKYEQVLRDSTAIDRTELLLKVQNNLAVLYMGTQRYSESETMCRAAMEIYERLASDNPSAFEPDLARTQMNLANLYYDTQRYPESETMYKAAMEIYERLASDNPSAFELDLAKIQINLAILYRKTQRYPESETMYKAAMEIYERLASDNPSAFEPDLANTQMNLANLYRITQRYSESETMYKAAMGTFERLTKENPQIYEIRLADCYYWLGNTMLLMKKYHVATEFFKQSLDLGRQIASTEIGTDIYWNSLAVLQSLSSNEKNYISAYKYNEELLPILKGFYEKSSDRWRSEYSQSLGCKAFYSNLLGKFQEGEQYSLKALEIDSTKHFAYTNLAAAMLFQGKTEEAEKLYRQYKGEFRDDMLDDFAEFERLGIIPEERKSDVERIKAILEE